MEPETQPGMNDEAAANAAVPVAGDAEVSMTETPHAALSTPPGPGFMQRVFIGDQGLRGGWSIALFVVLLILISALAGLIISSLHLNPGSGHVTVRAAFLGEVTVLLGLLGAAWVVALIERRRILDFNLAGPRPAARFFSGLAAGFLALSALVGALWSGGWLHFGPVALSGTAVAKYAALWGITFLLVGLFEEGVFRCYLQFTLTRAINFWWAIGIQALLCGSLIFRAKGPEAWGVYGIVLLGLVPCLMLHLRRAPHASFWQAAWVTSTLFGFIHVSNTGENWIGIFAAAAIGFVFCVSIWLTGSAWWAIGCHAGWDWGETYFYGTADSGMVAQGHYLTTSPFGNAFWSGGADGPEGSFLVLGAILLLLVALLVIYRPRKTVENSMAQIGDQSAR
jgi:membrane protease YdiL (CAAX protease family)